MSAPWWWASGRASQRASEGASEGACVFMGKGVGHGPISRPRKNPS